MNEGMFRTVKPYSHVQEQSKPVQNAGDGTSLFLAASPQNSGF
jgi:hypothetical protein